MQLEPSPPKDKSTPIDETNNQPRVKDISSDQPNPVSKSTPVEETNDQPRVKDTPNERPEPISTPRMDSIQPTKVAPKAIQPTYMAQQNPPLIHRYLTRLKVAKAATSI